MSSYENLWGYLGILAALYPPTPQKCLASPQTYSLIE